MKLNEPKKQAKKLIFRIFCELLAKTYLESLVNSGFPECTVEMVIARLRALTHLACYLACVEMVIARLRALTR